MKSLTRLGGSDPTEVEQDATGLIQRFKALPLRRGFANDLNSSGWIGLILFAAGAVAGAAQQPLAATEWKDELIRVERAFLPVPGTLGKRISRPIQKALGRHPVGPATRANPVQFVSDSAAGSRLGHSVASAGDMNGDGFDDVAVSGYRMGSNRQGGVRVYFGSPHGLSETAVWRIDCPTNVFSDHDPRPIVRPYAVTEGPDTTDFGHQVAGVGDVNGDGLDDLLVGATHYTVDQPGQGAAFVYYGARAGPPLKPDWQFLGLKRLSRFGFTVAAAGDVNGDGFPDVLVGAPMHENSGAAGSPETAGRAFLFLGGALGLSAIPAWTANGEQPGSRYGYAVHGAGDVNGDGFDDVLVGDHNFSGTSAISGKVYCYYGNSDGLHSKAAWTVAGLQEGQGVGNSVFSAGDVNRDGFSDVAVAANGTSHGQEYEGMIFVFTGSPEGLSLEPSWRFEPDQSRMYLGHSVATAGDLDGDGYDDLVASSIYGGQSVAQEGVVLVFQGSSRGFSKRPVWSACGGAFQSGFGATVRPAGDVDGDGFTDLIVGQPYGIVDGEGRGRAWLYYGSVRGLLASSGWRPPGEKFGFTWRRVHLPQPNAAWTSLLALLIFGAIFLLTRAYYLRRERMMARVQSAREAAQREERGRIAQDLHDYLGAHLTDIALSTGNARRSLEPGAKAHSILGRIEATASQLVDNLAEIVWLTQPANDTLDRFADYLIDYTSGATKAAGLRLEIEAPSDLPARPIDYHLRHDLLLAVKEALHNVVKHSRSASVALSVTFQTDQLQIEIHDQGQGFDPGGQRVRGEGLNNMRQRLSRNAGRCDVNSSADGTTVRLIVPLPPGGI